MRLAINSRTGEVTTHTDAPASPRKTQAQIAAENEVEAEESLNVSPQMKVILKQIFLLRKASGDTITQAEFLAELKADYKAFK